MIGSGDTENYMRFSAAIPLMEFPYWYPNHEDHEGPRCTVPDSLTPNSQGSSIELRSGVLMGEAEMDSDRISHFIDKILNGG